MYDEVDRLSDDFWTEDELAEMNRLIIEPSRYDVTPKHLCWYHLLKDGEYTYKSMLLAVESVVDGQTAVNNVITDIGLTSIIGDYGEESVLNNSRINALYLILEKHQYVSKVKFTGDDKVFSYEEWMSKLV